jgi:hypothetical protein
MHNQDEETVEVHRPVTEIEANIIRDILFQQGIDAGFNPNISSWFDGLFSLSMPGGVGRIFVLKKDAERAKTVISDYLAAVKEDADARNEDEAPSPDS